MIGVVQALKSHRRARARIPAELLHYLDEPILASGWYPEDDYHVLLQLLADLTPAAAVGGDVWKFFGKVGAQRDIAGDQRAVHERSRTSAAGLYKRFAERGSEGIGGIFLRATKLWALYHDTGTFTALRSRDDPSVVVLRLTGFRFPSRGVVELQQGYMVEYIRLLGHTVEGRIRRASGADGGLYEWEYRCARTPENLESLALLPQEE
jgi:hypothetical protein